MTQNVEVELAKLLKLEIVFVQIDNHWDNVLFFYCFYQPILERAKDQRITKTSMTYKKNLHVRELDVLFIQLH